MRYFRISIIGHGSFHSASPTDVDVLAMGFQRQVVMGPDRHLIEMKVHVMQCCGAKKGRWVFDLRGEGSVYRGQVPDDVQGLLEDFERQLSEAGHHVFSAVLSQTKYLTDRNPAEMEAYFLSVGCEKKDASPPPTNSHGDPFATILARAKGTPSG
jgi:hypothetical protein